jgi:hypothetical protein
MDSSLPLPTLLSNALVAFTIEFDNEFEHQAPHRTTNHGSTPGAFRAPWLVSMAMWLHFMQFIPDDGIPLRELKPLLRATDKSLDAWLTRMGKWWGYVIVEPGTAAGKSRRPHPDAIVRPTAGGRFRGQKCSHTIQWCCIAADSRRQLNKLLMSLVGAHGRSKKPGARPGYFCKMIYECLDRLNVLCLKALGAAHDVELHALTFLKAAEAVRVDRGEVHEDIFVIALACNEAEALGIVEPLDCTLFHFGVFLCVDIR